MKNRNIPKAVFFIASPFLVLPGILYGIYKKSNFSLGLLVIIFGLLSYLYIPNISNDRARYFEMYNSFQNFNFVNFLAYLADGRADFILHLIIFVAKKIGISLQFVLFFVTSFTVGVWFYLFNKIADKNKLANQNYFLCFLLVLFSFSLPDLFSGIRFYFASAFAMLAFYKGLYEGKKGLSIILLITAVFIHFSASLFFLLYLMLLFFPTKYKLYRIIFLVSFIFMILPKTFILSLIQTISFSGGYNKKVELYLYGDDFIEGGLKDGSSNYIYIYIFSIAWSFFAYLYLILTIKRKSLLRNVMYLLFGSINLFYAVPTIYARYLIVLKFVFVLLLVYEMINFKIAKPVYITLGFLIVSILSNLIILRGIIEASYFNQYLLTLPSIFFKEITPRDFLF